MKRIDGTPARLPRVKLLPGCLALALVVGSNVLSADNANAQVPFDNESLIPAAGAAAWSSATLIAQAQSLARTPPPVPANAIVVTNCNGSGPGSLSQAVLDASSGDTIDLTQLTCSTISVATGGISTSLSDLTLQGPGAFKLAIDGGNQVRPLQHNGSGTLHINDLAIVNGNKYVANGQPGLAGGACIQSAGTVAVDHAWINGCQATSASNTSGAKGGAIYAKAGISLTSSIVSNSNANSTASFAFGGGVYTPGSLAVVGSLIRGNVAYSKVSFAQGGGAEVGSILSGHTHGGSTLVKYSAITYNVAISDAAGAAGIGGGLYTTGNVTIKNTTIAGNQARIGGGLDLVKGANVSTPWTLLNDTVSSNSTYSASGSAMAGGIWIGNNATNIQNSTIAFNTVHAADSHQHTDGAGVHIDNAVALDLESTIISGNATYVVAGLFPDDIADTIGVSLTGANNLILWSTLSVATPPGTISHANPMLGPLSYNGDAPGVALYGVLQWTHALSPLSPAINKGNNITGAAFDQRGSGYPRTIGTAPDIGAFEFDLGDLIFANGFDQHP